MSLEEQIKNLLQKKDYSTPIDLSTIDLEELYKGLK